MDLNPTHNQRKTEMDKKIKVQKTWYETNKINTRTNKKRKWTVNPALEAETAITQLLIHDHEYHRKQLHNTQKHHMLQMNAIPITIQTQK